MTIIGKKLREGLLRFLPPSIYYGRDFRSIFSFLMKSHSWDRQKVVDYKFEKLKRLLSHAEKNVPYYRELFNDYGINSAQIKSPEDFARIHVLTKRHLRRNFDRLKANNFNAYHPIKTETSGTTGRITSLYRSAYQEAFRKAVLWRFYREHGIGFGHTRASITRAWGFVDSAPLYEHDKLQNNLIINMHQILTGRGDEIVRLSINTSPACSGLIPIFWLYGESI